MLCGPKKYFFYRTLPEAASRRCRGETMAKELRSQPGIAKERSMTRNQTHDRKWMKTWCNGDGVPWSDVKHDVLFLVMMQLGVIDFLSFSGVCKSWRSFALSKRKMFMASRPPMLIRISPRAHKDACYLIDFDERKFKTIIPQLVGRTCIGSTCGYLILHGIEERDIWLVNPITRHQLHFPDVPFHYVGSPKNIRGILIFSPSMSGWVFVMASTLDHSIWFSIAGKGAWKHVSSTCPIFDLHAFKGKIYVLSAPSQTELVSELRLNPQPKLTLLITKKVPKSYFCEHFVSSIENFYLMEFDGDKDSYIVHELDFDEMKWVSCEKTRDEYAFFLGDLKHSAAIKQTLWADSSSQCGRYAEFEKGGKGRFFTANMWYFPHHCLDIDSIDE